MVSSRFNHTYKNHQKPNFQKLIIVLAFTVSCVLAESAQDTNQRFFGGLLSDIFGSGGQCSNCRHNVDQARYCCTYSIDTHCCNSFVFGRRYFVCTALAAFSVKAIIVFYKLTFASVLEPTAFKGRQHMLKMGHTK